MQLVKKMTMVLCALFIIAVQVKAQSFEEEQKAFKASYAAEYKGDYVGAIAALQTAYKADSYESNLRMGWLQFKAKNYTKSLEYYQKAIDGKKFSVEARLGYITTANANKSYDKAYNMYEQILKIDPYNNTANYWVGVSYYTAKKYDVASKYFELVVNMYPFDYDANHMLAWTMLSLGKSSDAKELFKKALLSRPGDASSTDGLGKCK